MIHLVIEYYDISLENPGNPIELMITFHISQENRRIWHKPLVADLKTNNNKSMSDVKLTTRFHAKID